MVKQEVFQPFLSRFMVIGRFLDYHLVHNNKAHITAERRRSFYLIPSSNYACVKYLYFISL